MEKSKLVEILLTLDTREKRQFRLWLQSPVHNQRTDVVALFDLLSVQTEATKEMAWRAVHPTEPYDDARLRQVMYFLGKQLDDFLAWQEIQNDASLLELSKLRIYRRRQLEKPFKSTLTGLRTMLEQNPRRNSRYLRDVSMLELETFSYKSSRRRDQLLNLQETSDALDLAYLAERLRISCLMLSHQAVYRNVEYVHGPLQPLLAWIEEHALLNEPAIAVYYHTYYASIDRNNEAHFQAMLRLITEQAELFPVSELRELYLFALNYCIYQINTGNREYLHRAFEIYKTGIERQILFENGLVSRFTFMNAVVNAISIGQYDWASQLIKEHTRHLEPNHRESTVQIASARLAFALKDYDKAQRILHNYESDDLLLTLFARVLLIKIYFRHLDFEPLESLLDSMSMYLKRKQSLDPQRVLGYKNFIKMVRKLIRLWPLSDRSRAEYLSTLKSTQVVLEREWLEEIATVG